MIYTGFLHEILFRAKSNIFTSMSGQFLTTVYMIEPERKLTVVILIEMKSHLGDKMSLKHYLK